MGLGTGAAAWLRPGGLAKPGKHYRQEARQLQQDICIPRTRAFPQRSLLFSFIGSSLD